MWVGWGRLPNKVGPIKQFGLTVSSAYMANYSTKSGNLLFED